MPTITPGEGPFTEAVDFFRRKVNLPTERWDEMVGEIHAKGFTVAGATKAALLDDLRGAVNAAIENGETINDFRDRFDKIVQQHGWTYKGQRGWRTRVIYDTNLRTARMAGRWQQYQRVKDRRPYLQYQTAGDSRVRPEHAAWDNTVLHIDHPWWRTHYPPNGWGCRCTTRSLSERQLQREGKQVSPDPSVERAERLNPQTGEVFPPTPEGIDTGWDYNVGQAWLGPDQALAERVMRLPKPWRDQALAAAVDVARQSTSAFSEWAGRVLTDIGPRGELRTVGWLTGEIIDALQAAGVVVETPLITASDVGVRRMTRPLKQGWGKAMTGEMIREIPRLLANPKAVLLDMQAKEDALLYVLDAGDSRGKLVVRLGFRQLGTVFNRIVSGGIVPRPSLRDTTAYKLLSGEV